MTSPKIGFLCGSLRANSTNKVLEKALMKRFKKDGAKTSSIDLAAYDLPLYNGDIPTPSGVKKLIRKMKSYDGIVIVSPEYNGGVTPVLKNAIDWTSTVETGHFTGPVYGMAACTPGPMGGIMAMRQLQYILNRLGAEVIPAPAGCGNFDSAFDAKGNLIAEAAATRADRMKDSLLERIARKS